MKEKESQKLPEDLNILIATHTRTTGLSQVLKDWLLYKTETLIFIGHPLNPEKTANSFMEIYDKGILRKTYKSEVFIKSGILLYFKDAFFTVYYVLKSKSRIDIAIGVDNLNASVLIFLRKLKLVKKVIYHTVDYAPSRFSNKILNNIYHALDRWCCYEADILWNSSGRMNKGRVKIGADKGRIVKTIVTPDGSNFDPKKRLPISKIDRNLVAFVGHLRERLGLDLLIESFAEVVKEVKSAKLIIIGDGPLLAKLKKLSQDLQIYKSVTFTGFLENHEDVDDKLRKAAIGVAMFEPVQDSYEYYSDAGKPKVYLAAGLPTIITRVPEIADEIDKERAGLAIPYEKKELSESIVRLLTNTKMYEEYRNNAIELSKKYIWDNLFYSAFSDTLKHLYKN